MQDDNDIVPIRSKKHVYNASAHNVSFNTTMVEKVGGGAGGPKYILAHREEGAKICCHHKGGP